MRSALNYYILGEALEYTAVGRRKTFPVQGPRLLPGTLLGNQAMSTVRGTLACKVLTSFKGPCMFLCRGGLPPAGGRHPQQRVPARGGAQPGRQVPLCRFRRGQPPQGTMMREWKEPRRQDMTGHGNRWGFLYALPSVPSPPSLSSNPALQYTRLIQSRLNTLCQRKNKTQSAILPENQRVTLQR